MRFRYHTGAGFVTHCMAFVFLCLSLPAETAVAQDLCLVEGNTKIEICRGKWGFFLHTLLDKLALDWCNIEMPNNATLAWWLIMRTSRKRWSSQGGAGWWSWGCFFFFFFFLMFCVFLSRSLIDFSHPCNEKQRKNTLWPYWTSRQQKKWKQTNCIQVIKPGETLPDWLNTIPYTMAWKTDSELYPKNL